MRRLFISAFLTLLSFSVFATDLLTMENAWVREGPPTATVLAGFMTLKNNSDKEIVITRVESSDFASVEMHRTVIKDGMARMLPQETLTIPANGELVLEPGSYHLMLIGPKQPLSAGDSIAIHLYTTDEYCIDQILVVKKGASDDAMHDHHHE